MKDDDLIRLARERIDEAYTADIDNREQAADDLRMLTGDQWDLTTRQEREAQLKPCLTFNSLSQFVRQVTGQIRGMNPSIRVLPGDDEATEDVADIYAGLIRHIEAKCDAPSIYEQGAESAAACGIGHWRLRADYAEGDTFDQELMIERIPNAFSVFWDPMAKDPTRKDARFCFIVAEMAKEDFDAAYPGKRAENITSDHKPKSEFLWQTPDTVTVAEYFYIEPVERTIGLLATGQIVRDPVAALNVVKKRQVVENRVMWAKITGSDVLEGPQEVPSSAIPVVAVTGEEIHLGEKMARSSVIRYAKDAQQLYNYARSVGMEVMQLQPRSPYLITAKQVAGFEDFWNAANTANRAYLPYHPDPNAPPPMRVPPPVPSAAIVNEIQLAAEDMKRTTGIYDASLGARSNETSGVAIERRQMEAQNGTSVYADNMVKAIVQTGRILISMIRRVYDAQRVVRILGEDGQEKRVFINALLQSQDGLVPINDLTRGAYDVRISVGPSFQTKRAEASEGMERFLSAYPQAAPLIGDLIAKMQDWPESDRIAERLRKVIPPGVADEEDEDQSPEAMQAREQAAAQQQQAMQMDAAQREADVREKIAKAAKAEADAVKAQAEAERVRLELAQMNGQLAQMVNDQVRQTVAGMMVPQMAPQGAM